MRIQLLSGTSGVGSTRTALLRRLHAVTHHRAADHGDNEHESPVGNEAESPEDVADGNRKAELGNLAVEGMEPRVEELEGLLAVGVESDEVVDSGARHVEASLVDVNGSRLGQHLKGPDGADASGPRVAEDALVLAVENSHMRCLGGDGEAAGGFVEDLLDLLTLACIAC